jgi:hypothetical protein
LLDFLAAESATRDIRFETMT